MTSQLPARRAAALDHYKLSDGLSTAEALSRSGLDFEVAKIPAQYTFNDRQREVPRQFVTVRTDTGAPLGIVGKDYSVFQNRQLAGFLEAFLTRSGTYLDSCGFTRNGARVWAMASAAEVEYLPGDPSKKYFMIMNSFNGSTSLEVGFLDRRIVCNNMLTYASRHNAGFKVYHNSILTSRSVQIAALLARHDIHLDKSRQIMAQLTGRKLNARLLEDLTRTLTKAADAPGPDGGKLPAGAAAFGSIMELAESGRGTDIPGVRGSAYGWLNAVTEYVDHYRNVRPGQRLEAEARFESAVFGSGARLKDQAMTLALAA
jgi:phage/plasmid-like protein (TIGR03299 family)